MPFNIESHLEELTDLRHQLHTIAEVSAKEKETAKRIRQFLETTSPDKLVTDIGGHGILATYEETEGGSHILIRCELDALPITDSISQEYQSKTDGVGHKCGHDGHMAIVCGVARLLTEHELSSGKVSLLFQPAEETGKGAENILGDPKFKKISPDYCFALHNLPGFPKHQIVVRDNVFASASVGLKITFEGSTAHAAHPEEGKSPALAMAQTVQALSAVPQFYTSLEEAAKVTVIHANLGEEAFGTSPGKATVMATLRTYSQKVLQELQSKCIQIAKKTADTYNLSCEYEWVESFNAMVNDHSAFTITKKAAQQLDYDVFQKEHPFSWSEDFGHFTNKIPGAMFGLGVGENHPPLHAEDYDFPDDVILSGVSMFMQIITEVSST